MGGVQESILRLPQVPDVRLAIPPLIDPAKKDEPRSPLDQEDYFVSIPIKPAMKDFHIGVAVEVGVGLFTNWDLGADTWFPTKESIPISVSLFVDWDRYLERDLRFFIRGTYASTEDNFGLDDLGLSNVDKEDIVIKTVLGKLKPDTDISARFIIGEVGVSTNLFDYLLEASAAYMKFFKLDFSVGLGLMNAYAVRDYYERNDAGEFEQVRRTSNHWMGWGRVDFPFTVVRFAPHERFALEIYAQPTLGGGPAFSGEADGLMFLGGSGGVNMSF